MERFDIVIVGGGMAGLSAGLYAGWLGRGAVLIEGEVIGGQIINADRIKNFPGLSDGVDGVDLITQTRLQAGRFGMKSAYGSVKRIQVEGAKRLVQTDDGLYEAGALIIATGGRRQTLGIKGEAEYDGRGVSHCATCDGAFFAGKTVAVIGGGDTALDEGLFLTTLASKVTVVCRESRLQASHTLTERAKANPKMDFVWDSTVEEICGNGEVEAIRLRNLKSQNASLLPVAGIFVCIGFKPHTAFLDGIVEIDPMGHIEVDLYMQTSVPGIFAAGFARKGSAGQLASAAGDGVTAAVAAHRYLERIS